MQSEHKTQIYLSNEEYRALSRRARLERRSMAAIVREALGAYLAERTPRTVWSGDPILGLVGVASGRTDDSASIDDVLYGRQ
jgi:hypothetical protein